jgi:hypothetical protein
MVGQNMQITAKVCLDADAATMKTSFIYYSSGEEKIGHRVLHNLGFSVVDQGCQKVIFVYCSRLHVVRRLKAAFYFT